MYSIAQRPPRLLPFVLAGLAMVGPFSVDAIFPGFPALQSEFAANPVVMQQIISLYLAGFASMSLFHGPLSDAYGRRRIIIGSSLLFVVASVGVALSNSFTMLLVWRFIQGCSAGGGVVVGRAIIRDVASGPVAQRMISTVMMIFGVAPAIAPIAGAFLLNFGGWRAIFWAVALFALFLACLCQFCLSESLPPARRRPLAFRSLIDTYCSIGSDRGFVALALALALNFGALFLYVSSAPRFILDFLHLTEGDFHWLFIPVVSGLVAGSWVASLAAARITGERLLWIGYGIMGGACSVSLLTSFLLPSSRWLVLPLAIQAFGLALNQPILTLLALDRFPNHRGAAASVQAFFSLLINATDAGILSPLLSLNLTSLACGMLAINLLGFLFWFGQRSTDHAPGDDALLRGAPVIDEG
jgi:DHA1 family bicyclomycin/chloramphenicol resistance-like MFS transporter